MKKFYKNVDVQFLEEKNLYGVLLDGKRMHTPQKTPLLLPTMKLAQAVAAEWKDQLEETINLNNMPLTRHACTAIDRVEPQTDTTILEIANYICSDVVCYRAVSPQDLVDQQKAGWSPMVEWFEEKFNIELKITDGVNYVTQPVENINRFRDTLKTLSAFHLSALSVLIKGMGSVVLSMAVLYDRLSVEDAYALSLIDERFQIKFWGMMKSGRNGVRLSKLEC